MRAPADVGFLMWALSACVPQNPRGERLAYITTAPRERVHQNSGADYLARGYDRDDFGRCLALGSRPASDRGDVSAYAQIISHATMDRHDAIHDVTMTS